MAKNIVSKGFSWEMAHFIHDDNSKCKNIHGHSFTLEISVAEIHTSYMNVVEYNFPSDMIFHTGQLKALIQPVIDAYDHCLLMKKCPETEKLAEFLKETFGIVRVQYLPSGKNPTMENMIEAFWEYTESVLPAGIGLVRMVLRETPTVWIERCA